MEFSTAFRNSSFTPQEQQIILMTASHEMGSDCFNLCRSEQTEPCVLPALISEPIKAGKPIEIEKLQALRKFTSEVVTLQGWVNPKMVDEFLAAGYCKAALLDIQAGVSLVTLSHYTNRIAGTTRKVAMKDHRDKHQAPCTLVANPE